MITLITGTPGTGKTQKAIQLLLQCIKENENLLAKGEEPRPIFCDIAGINDENSTPLPSVEPMPKQPIYFGADDEEFQKIQSELPAGQEPYWLPPVGSIFFFDECQRVDWIKNSHGTLSKDVRTRSLETHRHRGLDFYLIAQGAEYIHSHVADLVGRHYHCIRPVNLPFCNVFSYNGFCKYPKTKSNKKGADDVTKLKIGKKLGQYYKSSAQHNMKAFVPKRIIYILIIVAVAILYVASRLNAEGSIFNRGSEQTTPEETNQSQPQNTPSQINQSSQNPSQNPDTGYHPRYLDYTNNEDMRPAMIIRTGSTCYARNNRGVPLDLDLETCNFYSDNQQFIPRGPKPVDPETTEDENTFLS